MGEDAAECGNEKLKQEKEEHEKNQEDEEEEEEQKTNVERDKCVYHDRHCDKNCNGEYSVIFSPFEKRKVAT